MEKALIFHKQKILRLGDFLFSGRCYTRAMNVARNTAIMIIGSVGQKIISLAFFTLLGRVFLTKPEFGDYTAALAFSTLFVVFIDLGLNNLLIRDGAQDHKRLSSLVTEILSIKLVTGILAYLAMLGTGLLLHFDKHFLTLISITGLAMLLDATHLTFYGYLRAKGELHYEAKALTGSQILTVAIGLTGLLLGAKVLFLLSAFVVTSLANVLFSYNRARAHGLVFTLEKPDLARLKKILLISWPFALALIFGRFYSYSDVIILKSLKGSSEVAVYSAPSKISFAFQFIPLAFIAALYPRLSELAKINQAKFREAISFAIKYLLLISVPISVGMFILAKPIILVTLSDKFLSSVPSLQILIFSLIFSFISFPLGAALNASGHEKKQTWLTGFTLLINVLANLAFIPRFGATGAATAALVGNICLGTAGFFLLPKHLKADWSILTPVLLKLIFVVGLMAGTVLETYQFTSNVFLAIGTGGIMYVGALWLSGLLKLSELKQLRAKV